MLLTVDRLLGGNSSINHQFADAQFAQNRVGSLCLGVERADRTVAMTVVGTDFRMVST